jgi:phosphohistidine swiveling domain-containing protein
MNKIIIVLVCLLIHGNIAFAQKNKYKKNTLKAPATEVIITDKFSKFLLEETEHDFGVINENGGLAIYNFSIKNTGNIPLIIQDVQPECGCTKTEWTTQPIAPGSIGNIKAVYNPAGRPGYFRKNITISTNTEVVKTVLHLKGNVAPAKYEFSSTYTYQYGFLAVNNNTFKFNVKQGKSDSTNLKIYNLSNKKMQIRRIETPPNIVVSGKIFELIPNTDADLLIKYWPRHKDDFGDFSQQIKIYTNDDSIPVKIIYVNSTITEDFSLLTPKELKKAPKFTIDRILHDFGDIGHNDSSITHFILTNKGKSDLIIRKAKPSCNCVNLELESMVIKPKQKIKMKVDYTSFNVVGFDIRGITLITNDPEKPEVNISIRANIVR